MPTSPDPTSLTSLAVRHARRLGGAGGRAWINARARFEAALDDRGYTGTAEQRNGLWRAGCRRLGLRPPAGYISLIRSNAGQWQTTDWQDAARSNS